MDARILPLDGKYYGTEISIVNDDGEAFYFKIWNDSNYEPSDRELGNKCTIEQWRKNEVLPIKNKMDGTIGIPAKEYCEICDSHFESRATYDVAKKIVKALGMI
jgi:hypothetical protein